MLGHHTSIPHAKEGGVRGIHQSQQMRCDTSASASYTAPRADRTVSRQRWSSQFGELCATVRPRTKSSELDSPLHTEKTGNFTLPNRFSDVLGGQGKLECLKGTFSVWDEVGRLKNTSGYCSMSRRETSICSRVSLAQNCQYLTASWKVERTVPDTPGGVDKIRA